MVADWEEEDIDNDYDSKKGESLYFSVLFFFFRVRSHYYFFSESVVVVIRKRFIFHFSMCLFDDFKQKLFITITFKRKSLSLV